MGVMGTAHVHPFAISPARAFMPGPPGPCLQLLGIARLARMEQLVREGALTRLVCFQRQLAREFPAHDVVLVLSERILHLLQPPGELAGVYANRRCGCLGCVPRLLGRLPGLMQSVVSVPARLGVPGPAEAPPGPAIVVPDRGGQDAICSGLGVGAKRRITYRSIDGI